MAYRLFILGLTGALLSVTFAQTRKYYFINMSKNWTDAQSFCRQDYSDLATIENLADVNAVVSTTSNYTGKAWIGLYDDLENGWKWSLDDSSFYGAGQSTYRNWNTGEPNNQNNQEYCVELLSSGKCNDKPCDYALNFVCFTDHVLVMNLRLKSLTKLSETEIEDAIAKLLIQYGLPPELSVYVRSVNP